MRALDGKDFRMAEERIEARGGHVKERGFNSRILLAGFFFFLYKCLAAQEDWVAGLCLVANSSLSLARTPVVVCRKNAKPTITPGAPQTPEPQINWLAVFSNPRVLA
jgi:hypothetical protein